LDWASLTFSAAGMKNAAAKEYKMGYAPIVQEKVFLNLDLSSAILRIALPAVVAENTPELIKSALCGLKNISRTTHPGTPMAVVLFL
jgi:hypothetical protein